MEIIGKMTLENSYDSSNFNKELKKRREFFDSSLDKSFTYSSEFEKEFNEIMLYSLKAGGKRLRPIIFLELAGNTELNIEFAKSLEMIHTYSLIHDDLPCMDDDDLRRGKVTSHKKYGEDNALLAGDGLLNLAYETMLSVANRVDKLEQEKYIRAALEVSNAVGKSGMIIGQVADIKNNSNSISLEELDFINKNKTGKLIMASFVAGAIIGGYSNIEIEKIRQLSMKLGIAFQIKDDLLDIYGDEKKVGKTIKSDMENDKVTYPNILGVAECNKLMNEYVEEILQIVDELSIESEFLISIIKFIIFREW